MWKNSTNSSRRPPPSDRLRDSVERREMTSDSLMTLILPSNALESLSGLHVDSIALRRLRDPPHCPFRVGVSISPYFFIFLYSVTRLIPSAAAARERL